ncbi:matrixin family metalloprotease [Trichothermofontia sp.]
MNARFLQRQRRWVVFLGLIGLTIASLTLGSRSFSPEATLAMSPPAAPQRSALAARPHPLPPFLAQWQDPNQRGDYFDQIAPSEVGYLVWSTFPITVYVEPSQPNLNGFAATQAETWRQAITAAIAVWHPFLPLTLVETPETADIRIWRSAPPIQRHPDGRLARIRAAETRYTLYTTRPQTDGTTLLRHRFDIYLSPHQPATFTQATARHELGHALGIWGHSPDPGDVLYYAQVRQPPPISARDLNTLKRIYEQPTQVGWPTH